VVRQLGSRRGDVSCAASAGLAILAVEKTIPPADAVSALRESDHWTPGRRASPALPLSDVRRANTAKEPSMNTVAILIVVALMLVIAFVSGFKLGVRMGRKLTRNAALECVKVSATLGEHFAAEQDTPEAQQATKVVFANIHAGLRSLLEGVL
jgi:hypothetical protein